MTIAIRPKDLLQRENERSSDSLRINKEITVPNVRLVAVSGEPIGVVSINEALALAREANLDLVEVSPKVDPPVCKIMDYGKFRYEQQKKKNEAKKKQKIVEIKEIQIRPVIDKNDFAVKMRAAEKFIANGDKVKFTMRFRGREINHQGIGLEILNKIVENFGDKVKVDVPPKLDGKQYMMLLSPNIVK